MSRGKGPESVIAPSVFVVVVVVEVTCVYAPVVLQVSSRGEFLATVLLLAGEGLLSVVRPHVNLQPLQHVETLPTALRAAPEHPVVPWEPRKTNNVSVIPAQMLYLQQRTSYISLQHKYCLSCAPPVQLPAP